MEDFTATDAIQALKAAGKKLPDDFVLIGFANEAFGEYITPSLSTSNQQTVKMGAEAAKIFLGLLDGEKDITQLPKTWSLIQYWFAGSRLYVSDKILMTLILR